MRLARSAFAAAFLLAAALAVLGAPAEAATPTPLAPAITKPGDSQRETPRDPHVDRVLTLENQRLALMPAVAAWKWQHHAAVTDAARERAIV
ncbi:MAG: hypothetical protein ACREUG_15420, partial [Steroidobacteraceae bacterium]